MRGTKSGTAYFGYASRGGWKVDRGGAVPVNDRGTLFQALDAALRYSWLHGGTVDVASRHSVKFSPVVDRNGLVAPLAVAPVAACDGSLTSVRLSNGVGADVLSFGVARFAWS